MSRDLVSVYTLYRFKHWIHCCRSGMDSYVASQKLPDVLRDTFQSTSPPRVAFKEAIGTDKSYFEWLSEKIERTDGTEGPRPSFEIFTLAMLGGGKVLTTPMNHGMYM